MYEPILVYLFQSHYNLLQYFNNIFLSLKFVFEHSPQSCPSVLHQQIYLILCFLVVVQFDDIGVVQLIEYVDLKLNSFVLFFVWLGGYILFMYDLVDIYLILVFDYIDLAEWLWLHYLPGESGFANINFEVVGDFNFRYVSDADHLYIIFKWKQAKINN